MSLPCSWPSKSFLSHWGWAPELPGGPQCPSWRALVTCWSSFSSSFRLLLPLQPFRTRCSSNPTATQSQCSAFPASVALDHPRYIVLVVTLCPLAYMTSLLLCEVTSCTCSFLYCPSSWTNESRTSPCRLRLKPVSGTQCHCVTLWHKFEYAFTSTSHGKHHKGTDTLQIVCMRKTTNCPSQSILPIFPNTRPAAYKHTPFPLLPCPRACGLN